jgi:hypothetical protein
VLSSLRIATVVVLIATGGLASGCGASTPASAPVSRAQVRSARAYARAIHLGSPVVKAEAVLLVPNINAGDAGWCVRDSGGFSCPGGFGGEPIVFEAWSRTDPPPMAEGYAVTTSEVAAVSVGGHSVPTRSEAELPDGLRAVAVDVRTSGKEESKIQFERARRPRFTALNAEGMAMGERRGSGRLLAESPTRRLSKSEASTLGACRIEALPLGGLSMESGSVVISVTPNAELLSGALLSCASTEYTFDGESLEAGVLINAVHPGRTPGSLPAMRQLRRNPGIFVAPGLEGEMLARRVRGGWLVVTKGASFAQRLTLLESLRAVVTL